MNQKQWERRQAEISREQKRKANESKMAMLGVVLKPPKSTGTWGTEISYMEGFTKWEINWNIDSSAFAEAYKSTAESFKKLADQTQEVTITWTFSWSTWSGPSVVSDLAKICPSLTIESAKCPECQTGAWRKLPSTVSNVIQHLNDEHQWSREKIADWLDTLDVDLIVRPLEKEPNYVINGTAEEGIGIIPAPGHTVTWSDWEGVYTGIAT